MDRRPNIVLVLCDQLRAFEVGCYGNRRVRTPHIDRLAAGGVRVGVGCSNHPVCTPARSVLMSGQYNRTCTGTHQNLADTPASPRRARLVDPTLPETLRAHGWRTGLVGKWHVHPAPELVGFDEAFYPHHRHRCTDQRFFATGGEPRVLPGFAPEHELARVDRFIAANADRPFFLFHSIAQPHMPLEDGPARYTRAFGRADVEVRANAWVDGKLARDDDWFRTYRWDHQYALERRPHTLPLPDGYDLRDLYAQYYGMVACADDQVGRTLAALERHGLADDTIVVLAADHGDNLGSHGRFNKQWLIEEAYRIPLIVRWPRRLAPRVAADRVVSLVDLMPTLLGLVGVPAPAAIHGADRGAALRGEDEPDARNAAFIETDKGEIGLRTARHLYGMRFAGDPASRRPMTEAEERWRFSDLERDPLELRDLLATGEQAGVADDLRARLRAWHAAIPWRVVADD